MGTPYLYYNYSYSSRTSLSIRKLSDLLTTKIGTTDGTSQTSSLNRSDRSSQLVQNIKWTSPLGSSRRVDQDSYIERPIWSPDEGDMTLGRSTPWADRSDRLAGAVRPVLVCRIRVKVVF